jgi:transcriptional regulator with XRE-family HTH domain
MLGAELKKARMAAGLTQEQLAHEAKLHFTYISMLETDKKSPTLDVLFRICRALGIPVRTLIARVERSMQRKGITELRRRALKP